MLGSPTLGEEQIMIGEAALTFWLVLVCGGLLRQWRAGTLAVRPVAARREHQARER
jgi:hypothetical protein